ncbi:MAG: hypothetical protein JO056_04255 [Alphaproteobacteria bacterium]|nr:hypothetical protein [Alphaproteobacteria bacterium]
MLRKILLVAAASLAGAAAAAAPQFKVLHAFCSEQNCTDGNWPYANRLTIDAAGNVYGITGYGGAAGWGSIFELHSNKDRTRYRFETLYSFCTADCSDGRFPVGKLVIDQAGDLYGTTATGEPVRSGHVFKLEKQKGGGWSLKNLYDFCPSGADGCADGQTPGEFGLTYAGLEKSLPYDGKSPLYGATKWAGVHNGGTIFRLLPRKKAPWKLDTIYSFCAQENCLDGYVPHAGLTLDSAGNIYGITTYGGPANTGLLYELSPAKSGWKQTVLYSFCSQQQCTDGSYPAAPVIIDGGGNLIGATAYGGANGDGTLYKLVPKGLHSQHSLIYNFCSADECADGGYPYGGLLRDTNGDIYGTAQYGDGEKASGVVYRFSDGALTVLHQFCEEADCPDGKSPLGGLARDAEGRLFGMTNEAGSNGNGGTVFAVTP